jgi:hypothetical protein
MSFTHFYNIIKILALLLVVISIKCFSDVRYVSKTGTSQFPYTSWETAADSIPKCLSICDNGDTIYVANGVYKDSLFINKEVSLFGSSMDSTIIDGTGLGFVTIEIQAKTVIRNFTIYGKAFNLGRGVRCYKPLDISLCKISNCGLGIGTIDAPCKMNNVIILNAKNGFDGGCLSDTCNYLISNSIIILNASGSFGIGTNLGGNYLINNNILIYYGGNNPDYGITVGWPKRIEIKNNLIAGFTIGIFFDSVEDSAIVYNNIAAYNNYAGIHPTSSNRVIIKNSMLLKNLYGMDWGHASYNLFWRNYSQQYYMEGDFIADPMFIKDTIPNPQLNFDYHLQAFSPAMHRGDPSILNKDGTRSDIGMYGGPLGETYTYQDLAPRPPANLSAVVDSTRITLKWNKNTEADTAYYSIYRDTTANFIIDSTKIVSKQKDTLLTQTIQGNAKHVYYKITVIDKQGNASQPSEEILINVTSIINSPQIISDYKLYQNYPNPFNPTTIISYRLKEKGYIKLNVYDIKGELIKILVNETKEQGYYETEFNAKGLASGIYLYRIEVIGQGNILVFTDMKKTILVK